MHGFSVAENQLPTLVVFLGWAKHAKAVRCVSCGTYATEPSNIMENCVAFSRRKNTLADDGHSKIRPGSRSLILRGAGGVNDHAEASRSRSERTEPLIGVVVQNIMLEHPGA